MPCGGPCRTVPSNDLVLLVFFKAFRRLGANVTVAARKVLPKEEPAASDVISKVGRARNPGESVNAFN